MERGIDVVDLFVAGHNWAPTYRIPSLAVAPDGTLLAFCECRRDSRRDDAPKDILLKRSEDSGRSWSETHMAVPGPGLDGINNPCPLVEGDSIYLFCINRQKQGVRCHQHLMARSDDNGKTWSDATDIGERFRDYDPTFVPGPGVCVRMRNGRWVVPGNARGPAFFEKADAEKEDGVPFSRVAFSDDQGDTWALGEAVDCPASNESQAVELSDGALILNFRIQDGAKGCRGMAVSTDGGESWRETFMLPQIQDPVCQGGFIRCDVQETAETADCLLLSNLDAPPKSKGGGRWNLTVWLSFDGGRTWPAKRSVHPGPAAYSCPAVLPDGTIGLLYECGDEDRYERIRFAKFDFDYITDGGSDETGSPRRPLI